MGKAITSVPRGSTKKAELAKQRWLVEFFIENTETGKNERFRLSNKLNKIKDYQEKFEAFTV